MSGWHYEPLPRQDETLPDSITTRRALEVVLSRLKFDPQTTRALKSQLAHEIQRATPGN